jgi:hypothetical protein
VDPAIYKCGNGPLLLPEGVSDQRGPRLSRKYFQLDKDFTGDLMFYMKMKNTPILLKTFTVDDQLGSTSKTSHHVNLFSYLVSEGYKVVLINPLLVSNYVKMQLRKTKTDKKNAVVIAQFLLTITPATKYMNEGSPFPANTGVS